MQDINIFRKIAPPALSSTVLHRAHLVSTLREAIVSEGQSNTSRSANKLVLLCAPVGYGKTTLLADFAASVLIPCCWYFLEHTDTDYAVFLRTLLASLCHAFPQLRDPLEAVFTDLFTKDALSSASIYQPAIDALCSTLAAEVSERFAIFLCNYEEINESETLSDLINYFLKKLPSQAVLVIESRATPDLDFASLLVHDKMFGLNSDALRFSAQEISELARNHGLTPLTPADAEQLVTSFDGWIAGILLGTHLGTLRYLPAAQTRKSLFNYVANEVFQRDPAIYRFLQPSSILQHMEAEICNSLLEITDSAELLDHLEQQGLFVSSSASAIRTIYTCHPIIRELLIGQFRQQEPERFSALQRQAAKLWYARQNYDQAMYHAFEAHAYDIAAQVILDSYKQFLRQGQLDTLSHWLHALPLSMREKFPRLLLIEASISVTRGQYASTLPLLDKISALIASSSENDNPAQTLLLQAETHIMRAWVLCQAGDYAQAQALCQQALKQLPDQEIELRAAASMRIGICANLQGDFPSSILHLQEALLYWDNQPPAHQAADIHGVLVITYRMIGNFALAEYHLARSLNYCEQLHDTQGKIENLIRQGIIYTNQGAYTEAETILQEALTLSRESATTRHGEAYALSNLGSLYLEQGRYAQALASCEGCLALAHHWEDRSLINVTLSVMSLAHLLMGDSVSALLFAKKIEIQAGSEKTVGYELAGRELAYGLIFFYQQRYDEAYACLAEIEKVLRRTGLKRELVQACLRLAACQMAREQDTAAMLLLEEVAFLLGNDSHYKQLVLVELRWLPTLLQVVKSLPQLARLRELLSLEAEFQEHTRDLQVAVSPVLSALPGLTIQAFGEPAVLFDNHPIEHWRMARAMELFFFLLDANRPLSRERIITELWPDFDEQTNQTFHSTLHSLRRLFGTSSLVFQAGGYCLNLTERYGENIWYDVQAFQTCYIQARKALSRADDTTARAALLQMLELYRGDYGQPFYSDWCTARRDELHAAYLDAHRHLAQIAWREKNLEKCTEHWQHMLRIDNCLEEAHLGLMQCYARQGKRSLALRQYRDCQETLRRELDIEPEPAIQQLYQLLTN